MIPGPPTAARRLPPWAYAATTLAIGLFCALGFWQFDKGRVKRALAGALADRGGPVHALTAELPAPDALAVQRVEATGTYLAERQLLQDGQSHAQRPGRHVWTPLQLSGGGVALVNRGWIPIDATAIPVPAGTVTVRGFRRALPEPGLRLGATQNCPERPQFPAPVLYPTHREIECLVGAAVLPGLLLLDPESPDGYVREWTDFGFPPERHYGYAFQWFALALAALVGVLVLHRKRQ